VIARPSSQPSTDRTALAPIEIETIDMLTELIREGLIDESFKLCIDGILSGDLEIKAGSFEDKSFLDSLSWDQDRIESFKIGAFANI